MNNAEFHVVLKQAFLTYLRTSPRSNEKLKILHGAISQDLSERLGSNEYGVFSLGFQDGKEKNILGRDLDKTVDVTVVREGQAVAGIAVKFV